MFVYGDDNEFFFTDAKQLMSHENASFVFYIVIEEKQTQWFTNVFKNKLKNLFKLRLSIPIVK